MSKNLTYIPEIISKGGIDEKLLSKKEFTPKDIQQLASILYEHDSDRQEAISVKKIAEDIQYIYTAYLEQLKLGISAVILDWDPALGRFYIKKKEKAELRYKTFIDFLIYSDYLYANC